MKNIGLLLVVGLVLFLGTTWSRAQGSLTPSGAPAPTMKSLAQIEPRTPIDSTHTPGDATNLYSITQPGSYYLTTNLVGVAGKNGIGILTNGVTIDLNGFTLIGPGGTNGCGITSPYYGWNVLIRNGTIQNWGFAGVLLDYGNAKFEDLKIYGPSIYGIFDFDDLSQFHHCSAFNFSSAGFATGNSDVLTDCTAYGMNGSVGFAIEEDCVLNHCASENCGFGYSLGPGSSAFGCTAGNDGVGYVLSQYCTVKDCNALFTKTNGFDASFESGCIFTSCNAGNCDGSGIVTGDSATVANCSANENILNGISAGTGCTITGCTANQNGYTTPGIGILTGTRATISNCTANNNQGDGIRFGGDSIITGCHASSNGQGAISAGLRSAGSGSRVDGNQARDNVGTGILASTSDVVIRNTCGNNSVANFNPSTGSNFAPIQTPASATNPLANIVF